MFMTSLKTRLKFLTGVEMMRHIHTMDGTTVHQVYHLLHKLMEEILLTKRLDQMST
jgi:hypothetical protein